jgi:ADP-ribosylglycohydrolase
MMTDVTWIPELERETVPLLRVFLAEKWLVTRLYYGHVDPREAGVGNVVNCGAAMYMAPVGIANAANPAGAYAEALEIAGAHQSSYGREAAAVFAAAVASAFRPGATVDSVLTDVLALAQDGTRMAIESVLEQAERAGDDWAGAIPLLRNGIEPFDTVGDLYRIPAQDSRRPSRLKSIEELPVALGFLKVTDGDVRGTILGATNYGRDSDSIATMGGAIAAALNGEASVPVEWAETVATNSKLDLRSTGITMAKVATEIFERDLAAHDAHSRAMSALVTGAQSSQNASGAAR